MNPLLACVQSAGELSVTSHVGIARSHDSFYIDNQDEINEYWSKQGLLGSDMETAALLTVARLRGLKAASILNNVVLWGEDTFEAIGSYVEGESAPARGERLEITVALEAFVKAERGELPL